MKKITFTLLYCFLTAISFSQNNTFEDGLKAFDAKEYMTSFEIMKPHAEAGNAAAQFIVGFCYFNKDLLIKNNALAESYLLKSAKQKYGRAMGLLAVLYFEKGMKKDSKYKIDALVWAEIAAAYDLMQKRMTTRHLIKSYLSDEELKKVVQVLKEKKKDFDKIDVQAFIASLPKPKSDKLTIPKNTLGLMKDPYRDWVSRWKYDQFECDTIHYTKSIDVKIINETIAKIESTKEFELSSLYRGKHTESIKLTSKEKEFIIEELSKLTTHEWEKELFPYSKRLDSPEEIQATFDMMENLESEAQKGRCAIVYTFSKPIFLRNKTLALFLDQKRYRGNYTQLNFSFYSLEYKRWQKLSGVYQYYESSP
ncbi:sel1 repeat family protein [Kordia algicida OT-1]|uniref:Sel1 repeat family protein n=1 Tax=Kordia algicida OT-1 TaxID=391587 RepID=A9DV20_9FLAO|nr:sel1 repeat family protein [Kordia algicida]EDP96363.1 hypothetical protein KAOT1_03102 [Kordia algicida OT-1]